MAKQNATNPIEASNIFQSIMKAMNITGYNKHYLFIGFIISSIGSYLEDEKTVPTYLAVFIIIAGIILMRLSMKKPKEVEN